MIKPLVPRNYVLSHAIRKAHGPTPKTYVPYKDRKMADVKGRRLPPQNPSKKPVTLPKVKWLEE